MREAPADQVLLAVERPLHSARGGVEALAREGGALGVALGLAPGLEQRRLELGRGEAGPLVDERPVVRADRRQEARLGVQVAEVQAQRRGLEQKPLVVLQHRNAAERMTLAVLLATPLLTAHHGQLVGLAHLLERPQDAQWPSSPLPVKDTHRAPHDNAQRDVSNPRAPVR